jgi:hypothetical protein
MKLKAKKDESQMSGVENAKEFSIDTESSMIVSILRDKLYRNKVAAVCREIASNCRDANREAGREKTPIRIEIHNDEDNFLGENSILISFSDNGIGISPDRMEKIFLKYGGSTKRNSNNQTGGFGIGAKTPFAYTNNFLITTIADVDKKRVKYVYQALIIADGIKERSQLVLIDSEETKEDTGTTITVPIGSNESKFNLESRVREFEYECLHATAMWDVKPLYKGFKKLTDYVTDKELKVYMSGKGWKIVEDKHGILNGGGHIIASVDGIPYAINNDEIKEYDLRRKLTNFTHGKLYPIIEIKTGEITLSASREDVEYIPENIEVFIKKYEAMKDALVKEAKEFVEKEKTVLGKVTIANKILGKSFLKTTEQDAKCKVYKDALGGLADTLFMKEIKDMPTTYNMLTLHLFDFIVFDLNNSFGSCRLDSSINVEDLKGKKVFYRAQNSCSLRNSTLRKSGEKTIVFIIPKKDEGKFLVSEKTEKRLEEIKKLLLEIDITVESYDDVEKDKREVKTKIKKESDEGVLVPFRSYPGHYNHVWPAKNIECGKKSLQPIKDITDNSKNVIPNDKIILLTVASITSLNVAYKSETILFGHPNIGTKQALLPEYCAWRQNEVWSNTFQLLKTLGYHIYATSSSKEKYFKNAGFKTKGDIKKIIETEWLKAQTKSIQEAIDYDAGQKLNFVKHLDSKYFTYPEFLSLVDISVEEIKKSNQIKEMRQSNGARELGYRFKMEDIYRMAKILKLTPKDYGVKITHSQVEAGLEVIKRKYPAISIIFERFHSWDSSIKNHGGEGHIWKQVLLPMIQDALSKREKQ